MAKAEAQILTEHITKHTVEHVTLKLTPEETRAIYTLLRAVGGDLTISWRKHTDDILAVLESLNILEPEHAYPYTGNGVTALPIDHLK